MRRTRLAILAALVIALAVPVGAASATTTHPTYALGKAKSCKANYVKTIVSHKVKGKTVDYIACVYKAPKTKPKPVSTPTPKPAPAPTTTTQPTIATNTILDVTSDDLSGTELVDATVNTSTSSGNGSVTGGTWSISVIDTTSGTTLGTWTSTGSSNAIVTNPSLGITWNYVNGTMTLGAAFSGVTWSGPASIGVNPADASSLDIAIQGSYSGATGFGASKSNAMTVVL